jgi:hypothetical protein
MLLFSLFTFSFVMAAAILILRELALLDQWIQWFLPGSGASAATVTARKFAGDQKIISANRFTASDTTLEVYEDLNQATVQGDYSSIPADADTILIMDRHEKLSDRTISKVSVYSSKSGVDIEMPFLEDKWVNHVDADLDGKSDTKVYGETAIPDGIYELGINKHKGRVYSWMIKSYSAWFEHVIEINDVEYFDAIFIHPGNTPVNTKGCPLPASSIDAKTKNGLRSADACKKFYGQIYPLLKSGKRVFIVIK